MKILATFIIISIPLLLFGQSKKELKDAGVISRTEKTSKLDKKIMINYTESIEKYDGNGNKTEVIEYKSDGEVKVYDQFEYNEKGKLLKEIHLDPKNKKPMETIDYTYGEDDKVAKETYYNKKGELSKTVEYTYVDKLKSEKKTTDAKGKIIETKTYTYEKKQ